jgi:hypothetical protein
MRPPNHPERQGPLSGCREPRQFARIASRPAFQTVGDDDWNRLRLLEATLRFMEQST